MNYYAYFFVNHPIEFLLEQSATRQRDARRVPKPTLRARTESVTAGLRRIFTNRIDDGEPILPKLENYPYRD